MGKHHMGGEYVAMSSSFTPSVTDVRHTRFTLPAERETITAEGYNDNLRKLANNEAGTRADLDELAGQVGELPSVGTLNGISMSQAITVQGTADQIAVSTAGRTITARLTTAQPAGDYVMRSDGAGGVTWSPFESGGLGRVGSAFMGFFVGWGQGSASQGLTLTAIGTF